MAYNLITEFTLEFTGGPMIPKGWAIHWWGDPNQRPTFDGILNVLLNRSAQRSASVNFMAESGKVACLVSPFTIAYAQGDGGNGWGNNNLVSVECNPRCTAEDRETVAELIADQHIQNGIPIVLYPHKRFTATQCPGVWEQWIPWLTQRANEIVAEKSALANTGETEVASFHPDKEWFQAMIQAMSRLDNRSNYVQAKGTKAVYDITGGIPRHITPREWAVVQDAGYRIEEVEQSLIDAWVTEYSARNPS